MDGTRLRTLEQSLPFYRLVRDLAAQRSRAGRRRRRPPLRQPARHADARRTSRRSSATPSRSTRAGSSTCSTTRRRPPSLPMACRATPACRGDAEDVAMTNGGWGAIAIAMRMLTEPGDEVIYYDPPWFFYDLLVRGAEAVPVADARSAALLARSRPALADAHHAAHARRADQHAAQPDRPDPRRRRARGDRRGPPRCVGALRAADLPALRRGVPPDRARRPARAQPGRALRPHARPVLVRQAAAGARAADRLPRALAADPRGRA